MFSVEFTSLEREPSLGTRASSVTVRVELKVGLQMGLIVVTGE